MATIILTAVGSAVGGPIGSAIGSFIGQQIDQAVFGPGSREGPRLQELAVTTSSYGRPMPRIFGQMRVPGSIIWSTDLIETSEKTGGGKGKPSTTTYNYSASFAVALSSTPISALGRIWADGELLRGAAGDLKVEGKLRTYRGHGDDIVDPTLAASIGGGATGFRDCAYVVFEDLSLGDFGNRIPALTFEIFGEKGSSVSLQDIVPDVKNSPAKEPLSYLLGFADQGGSISGTLSALSDVFPISCVTTKDGLQISVVDEAPPSPARLVERLQAPQNATGFRSRSASNDAEPNSLRYYDLSRDYQPSVQRAIGDRSRGQEKMVDLPATLNAAGAQKLANQNRMRSHWQTQRINWSSPQIDPQIAPGAIVLVNGFPGYWLVVEWEWLDQGLQLSLERTSPASVSENDSDPGQSSLPPDKIAGPTILRAFELPPESTVSPTEPLLFAAASSPTGSWRGAALFVEQANGLASIGNTGRARTPIGHLAEELASSSCTHFEPAGTLVVDLVGEDFSLSETTMNGLAMGANRLLVGGEVIQYLEAEQISTVKWRLTGLLRGRGGTEWRAANAHPSGTDVIFIGESLISLDPAAVPSDPATKIAALGMGDTQTVIEPLQHAGLSRQPLAPVHPLASTRPDGSLELSWVRRGRGQWLWRDVVDIPLVEESEVYQVGYGEVGDPLEKWNVTEPKLVLSQSELTDLYAQHGSSVFWVAQVGTFNTSAATRITNFQG